MLKSPGRNGFLVVLSVCGAVAGALVYTSAAPTSSVEIRASQESQSDSASNDESANVAAWGRRLAEFNDGKVDSMEYTSSTSGGLRETFLNTSPADRDNPPSDWDLPIYVVQIRGDFALRTGASVARKDDQRRPVILAGFDQKTGDLVDFSELDRSVDLEKLGPVTRL